MSAEVQGQVVTLSNLNAQAQFNLGSAGMFSWTINAVNQLQQQQFYYRVGASGAENALSVLNASPSYTLSADQRTLTTLYSNGTVGVQLKYTLTGNSPGTGAGGLSDSITVFNYSGSSQDFHLFGYSHFILQNTAGGQYVNLSSAPGFNQAIQTIGPVGPPSLTQRITGTQGASHTEVAPYSQILGELTDGNPTTFNGSTSISGADATFGFQWDFSLLAFGSAQLSEIDQIQIPEPSALGMVGLGFALALYRTRKTLIFPHRS